MSQQVAGHSDEVTIEHGESKGLSVCKLEYSDVFSMFDVEGCACDLFVRGPGNQHRPRGATTPSEAPSCGERWSGDKVGVFALPSLPSWLKQLLAGRQEAKDPFNPKGWSPICFQKGPQK